MKKAHLTMAGYTGGQSPDKPEKEANDAGHSEPNESTPNRSQFQSDVYLVEYPKLRNQTRNLEEVVELVNQQPEDNIDHTGGLEQPQPQNTGSKETDRGISHAHEKESDVVLLEFLSEHEQQADEVMNKEIAKLNKSAVSIKENSKTPSYDDQSAKSNQQFMEEQIESDDFIKQSVSAYDTEGDSTGSQPSNKEFLDESKDFIELPKQRVGEYIEVLQDIKESVESQPLKEENINAPPVGEYTGLVRSIFGPEPIRDYPNSLEELLSDKPRSFAIRNELNNVLEPCITMDIFETQEDAYGLQPSAGQADLVPAAESSHELNTNNVIKNEEFVTESKISSGDNILQSNVTIIEGPCVTGELTEPIQKRYNDLRKLSEILKAGLQENDQPKKSEQHQDNSEANAPEANTEETEETLFIDGQAANPPRMLEYHHSADIKNRGAVKSSNSRQLQIESPSRHSDPGATDAGTRKAFKDEIKYLTGHPQFRYLDAVSSATNVQKNSEGETTDLPGGGKSGDGTLNVGTKISKVSQLGQEKSKASLGVEHASNSDSVLYQDSQITVKKPKEEESGISEADNRSQNFDFERRNSYGALVERKRLVETGLVIRDVIVISSDHIKLDIEEESAANFGDLIKKSASINLDQRRDKKSPSISTTDDFQAIQDSNSIIKEPESSLEETSKMKVRVEFKELQNEENQETEGFQSNAEDQNAKNIEGMLSVSKDKNEEKVTLRLPSSQALRSPSSQLLRPIESSIVAELSAGHLQEVNHPSVYSIYMQPNNANAPQVQSETMKEFKLAQLPQRTSNENIPLKSIKKASDENVINQRLENTMNVSPTSPIVMKDSIGTPEISRTMKKGDISKSEPKDGAETTEDVKNEPLLDNVKDQEIRMKPSVTMITVAGAIPKVTGIESKTTLPDTNTSASELKKKVSIIETKIDVSETKVVPVLTGAKREVSKIKIASEEMIVNKISNLDAEDTKAEQPPHVKMSEPFSNLLKQDSRSKLPEPVPKDQRGRVLSTPETKRRISKEFSRSRSGSVNQKTSKTKSQLEQKESQKDRKKKSTPKESRVILNERDTVVEGRTKMKRFTEACSKFIRRFKKPRSSE